MEQPGRSRHFRPVEETVTTAPAPLFRDITAHAFQQPPIPSIANSATAFPTGARISTPPAESTSTATTASQSAISITTASTKSMSASPAASPIACIRIAAAISRRHHRTSAGVGVLDPTSSALFLDLRNSGLRIWSCCAPMARLLFLNQGGGRFTHQPGAFRFRTDAARQLHRHGRRRLRSRRPRRPLSLHLFLLPRRQPVSLSHALITTRKTDRPISSSTIELAADGSGMFLDVTECRRPQPQQQSLQLRARLVRLQRRRLARPLRRQRFRPQESVQERSAANFAM